MSSNDGNVAAPATAHGTACDDTTAPAANVKPENIAGSGNDHAEIKKENVRVGDAEVKPGAAGVAVPVATVAAAAVETSDTPADEAARVIADATTEASVDAAADAVAGADGGTATDTRKQGGAVGDGAGEAGSDAGAGMKKLPEFIPQIVDPAKGKPLIDALVAHIKEGKSIKWPRNASGKKLVDEKVKEFGLRVLSSDKNHKPEWLLCRFCHVFGFENAPERERERSKRNGRYGMHVFGPPFLEHVVRAHVETCHPEMWRTFCALPSEHRTELFEGHPKLAHESLVQKQGNTWRTMQKQAWKDAQDLIAAEKQGAEAVEAFGQRLQRREHNRKRPNKLEKMKQKQMEKRLKRNLEREKKRQPALDAATTIATESTPAAEEDEQDGPARKRVKVEKDEQDGHESTKKEESTATLPDFHIEHVGNESAKTGETTITLEDGGAGLSAAPDSNDATNGVEREDLPTDA